MTAALLWLCVFTFFGEQARYFKEDHLTGADYICLDADQTYRLIAREHTGIWVLESGRWRQSDDAIGFTPDGSRLVFGGYDKVLHVWDATTFQPLTAFAWHTHPVAVLALSPDGRLLATGGADGVVHFWPTEMITGTKPDAPARR